MHSEHENEPTSVDESSIDDTCPDAPVADPAAHAAESSNNNSTANNAAVQYMGR